MTHTLPLRCIIMRVTERHEVDSVNGPMVEVVLEPDKHTMTSMTGRLSFIVQEERGLDEYHVGKRVLLQPELLP